METKGVHRQMNKQNVVPTSSRALLRLEKEGNANTCTTWVNPDDLKLNGVSQSQGRTLCDPISMRSPESQIHRHEKRNGGHCWLRGGEKGSQGLMGTQVHFGKMKFWRWMTVMFVQ